MSDPPGEMEHMNTAELRRLKRDIRPLAITAFEQGWTVVKTNGGHLKWTSPTGMAIFSASTPSDARAVRNIRSLLRRNGLIVHTC